MLKRFAWALALALFALVWTSHPVALDAQNAATAQLAGTVHDSQGLAIAGAQVTITDDSKGFSRTTASNGEGI